MEKKLYYPVKPISVNQPFGANYNAYYAQKGQKGHGGIDFKAVHGQKIYATHDGVCYPQVDDHGGNGVKLIGKECTTIYWHLIDDDAVVHTKQEVRAGDLLGYADNTGQSTGDHLHFALRLPDTMLNNGYGGYVDPQPYFNGKYAEDIYNPIPPTPAFQFTLTTRQGSWNNDVKQMQILLKLTADGVFGPITKWSVIQFQKSKGLVGDGIVGSKTRTELNKLLP